MVKAVHSVEPGYLELNLNLAMSHPYDPYRQPGWHTGPRDPAADPLPSYVKHFEPQPTDGLDRFNARVDLWNVVASAVILAVFLAVTVAGVALAVPLSRSGGGWFGIVYATVASTIVTLATQIAADLLAERWLPSAQTGHGEDLQAKFTAKVEKFRYLVALGYGSVVLVAWIIA